jgi:DsbC/DsbD-like thiol-disulfide interchange protein
VTWTARIHVQITTNSLAAEPGNGEICRLMAQRFLQTLTCRLGLAMLIAGAASLPVRADDASPWVEDSYSRMRLIAGANPPASASLRAGIDLELAPGWKTYWRYPGDSGIPPQFDFAGSDNVKSVEVRWPAPVRFADGGGQAIGYRDRVILPLRIAPVDPARPAVLRLDLRYGVCAKLCVPAAAMVQLRFGGSVARHDAALAAAEARVPVPARVGAPDPLAVRAVRRQDASKPRIVVEVAAPPGAAVDLFAEGPSPDWALPLPEPAPASAPGMRQFSFALDGLPTGATARGAELTLTLVGPTRAVEVKTRLD